MPRWIELDTALQDDDRIARVLRTFGNAGLGALLRTWTHVGSHGALPGSAVNSDGQPFELANMARRAGVSVPYFRRLMDACATSGHIDRELWRHDGIVKFPALARRLRKYYEAKSGGERVQSHRDRVFARVSERCGNHCVRCGATEGLELERIVSIQEGGTNAEANLQTVCVPCGRKRRVPAGEAVNGSAGTPRNAENADRNADLPANPHLAGWARKKVFEAVRDRRVNRPAFCPRCSAEGAIEARHADYAKPLELEWLCRKCHARWPPEPSIENAENAQNANAGPIPCTVVPGSTVLTGISVSTDHTDTFARARVAENDPALAVPLPLVGEVPRRAALVGLAGVRPRGLNPAQNPATVMEGELPRNHLKCLAPCGVICYPLGLAEEHARALNMADKEAAFDQVRAFRDRILAAIPEGQPIGDRPYDFWRAHWAHAHPSAAPALASTRRGGGPDPSVARKPAPAGKYDHMSRGDQDHAKRSRGGG